MSRPTSGWAELDEIAAAISKAQGTWLPGAGRSSAERSLQSLEEQVDQAAGVIAGIAVTSDAEVADAAHQFVGVRAGPDFARADRGVEQLGADGHQAVEEVGVQRVEAAAVRLQRLGQPVLGDQEINEEVDPLTQRRERRAGAGQQGRAGLAQASTWWR